MEEMVTFWVFDGLERLKENRCSWKKFIKGSEPLKRKELPSSTVSTETLQRTPPSPHQNPFTCPRAQCKNLRTNEGVFDKVILLNTGRSPCRGLSSNRSSMLEKHNESGKAHTLAGSQASQATVCPGPGFCTAHLWLPSLAQGTLMVQGSPWPFNCYKRALQRCTRSKAGAGKTNKGLKVQPDIRQLEKHLLESPKDPRSQIPASYLTRVLQPPSDTPHFQPAKAGRALLEQQ